MGFILIIDNAGKVQTLIPPNRDADSTLDQATQQVEDSDTRHGSNENRHRSSVIDASRKNDSNVAESTVDRSEVTEADLSSSGNSATQKSNQRNSDPNATEVDSSKINSGAGVDSNFDTQAFEQEATAASDMSTVFHETARDTVPRKLGGYRLGKQLGKGGMGTVFQATQLSLDRDVAIKILKPSLTTNPSFVSRFVREAYAVAQLVHHNVVQVYDIGSQGDVHYFSMELVKGDSLSGILKRQRRLDCDTAAGYVLQAARGLKFAHDQGMVHRDVKPANLMLDEHGIVKVADLGLVKLDDEAADGQMIEQLKASPVQPIDNKPLPTKDADTQITQIGVSVGTPSYMAPEQWKRASNVDHRADIYSLGATFYVLVTGKLPFAGKTPKEVITKVITDKAIPPELLVKDIPKKISVIVSKMIAKDVKDRYPDMSSLISDLEEYLCVSSSGAFSPSERHVEILEKSVGDFNKNPFVKIRGSLFQGSLGLATLLILVGVFFSPWFGMLIAGTVISTGVSYFFVRGAFERTHLFNRTRDYLFSNSIWDWITFSISLLVAAVMAFFILELSGILIVAIAGPLLGIGIYFGIDKVLAVKRKPAIDESEKLFKVLRLRGLNEDLLRQFVCKFAGNHWEEYFEELFGYPAKLRARNWLRGETGKRRSTFRWWRDPLVKWLDNRFEIRDQSRQKKHMEKIEYQKLLAQGVEKAEAKVRARNIAKLVTENAEAWKQSQSQMVKDDRVNQNAPTLVETAPTLSNLSRNLDGRFQDREPKATIADRFNGLITLFIGPRVRFLIGIVLIGMCLWWMQQNGKVAALQSSELGSLERAEILFGQNSYKSDGTETGNLASSMVSFLPGNVGDGFNSINHGVIGLIFVFSATVFGWFVFIPVTLGGAIAMYGSWLNLIPEQGIWVLSSENLLLIVGGFVAIVGCFLLNSKKEAL